MSPASSARIFSSFLSSSSSTTGPPAMFTASGASAAAGRAAQKAAAARGISWEYRVHQCDQVIRGNPASRGTETSAEVLVGPPWRMESNAGQQQWY